MTTPGDYRQQATDALFKALSANNAASSGNLLYDPTSLHRPQDNPPTPKIDITTPPKLLAAGADDTLDGHHSHEILSALAAHSNKMVALDAETAKLNEQTFGGASTSDIAAAIVKYAKEHGGALPPSLAAGGAAAKAKLMAADSAGVTATVMNGAYSLAATLQSLYWARVIYCITWIVAGLVLLFFGYSSLFWANRIGAKAASSPSLASEVLSGRKPKANKARPAILGGGVGGILIGFLFFSYLAAVIHSAVCADQGKPPLPGAAFFAVWLVPGLVGAALGGHFAWAMRIMSGLAAGPCLTVILTAVFGVHTILARSILFAIFTVLLTLPVVLPKRNGAHSIVLMLNTSLLGVVTFLDGVALFAPPPTSSASWIDLWVLLFAKNGTASQQAAVYYWGSSAFKGYIAGAVLGALIGLAFEFLLHRHAGEDPELEFNSYLGAYAERVKQHQAHGGMPGAFDGERAGLFSPTPGAWQKVRDMFEAARTQSATYGNLPGGQRSREASPLTDLPPGVGRGRSGRTQRSGRTARGVPARFEALSARDKDVEGQDSDSDSDATDVDSDAELDDEKKALKAGSNAEALDKLSPLARATYAMPPKPPMLTPAPSYRTDASGGSGSSNSGPLTSSTLSGTTAGGPTSPTDEVHKALDVYRDGDAARSVSPPAATTAPVVPATPSLINAISRIQQAQAQARAWQAMQAAQGAEASPYGTAPELPSAPGSPAPAQRQSAAGGGDFDGWWKKQVAGGKKV